MIVTQVNFTDEDEIDFKFECEYGVEPCDFAEDENGFRCEEDMCKYLDGNECVCCDAIKQALRRLKSSIQNKIRSIDESEEE